MITRITLTLILTIGLTSTVEARLPLAADDRVANESPGFCFWCSIETQARALHIDSLRGLKDLRKRNGDHEGADIRDITDQLDALHVVYYTPLDFDDLRRAAPHGASIGVIDWPDQWSSHAILLTDWQGDEIEFYDSNDPMYLYICTPAWLREHWTGEAITLAPFGISRAK